MKTIDPFWRTVIFFGTYVGAVYLGCRVAESTASFFVGWAVLAAVRVINRFADEL